MTETLSDALASMATELNQKNAAAAYAPKANGGSEPLVVDVGVENMANSTEMCSKAFAEKYDECAKRCEDEIASLEKIHLYVVGLLKREAESARARGAEVAKLIKNYGTLAQSVAAASAASTKALREAEPK